MYLTTPHDPDSPCAVEAEEHAGLVLPRPAAEAEELPADRTLVAAAALTGADLTLLPSSVSHGGGAAATLRWDEQA